MRSLPAVLLLVLIVVGFLVPSDSPAGPRGIVLEDFESGSVTLESFEVEQDQEPNDWEVTGSNTHGGSNYALRIYGNSWKSQSISPYEITAETVLSIAIYVDRIGEMQAFGIGDGTNALLYTVSGTQLPTAERWELEYQGAFPDENWNVYLLPIGRDFEHHYGYLPMISQLIYVNDRDEDPNGITIFDDIIDVTDDLPVPPDVTIFQGGHRVEQVAEKLYRVGIQFHASVYDPDSDTFTYHWDFGDSTFSSEAEPYHEFLVESDHMYTVRLDVKDDADLWGYDTEQVVVEPGGPDEPSTMNIVGDVMLARRYEDPGGIIDELGVEAIFAPTLPIFGEAAEINICNLESPLTDEGERHPTKSYVFRGDPSNVAGLTYAGIDVVSLGNNHIIDYGQRGMEETQEVLDAAEIRWSGAGDNEYFAMLPTFWTEDGISIAFLGQCNRTGREWNYQPFLDAATNKPGFAHHIEPIITESIEQVREIADLVVLQAHSGIEYSTGPGADFGIPDEEPPIDAPGPDPRLANFSFPTRPALSDRQLRLRAVEAGADLVICHHPHVLQGFEVYQGILIAHSMGNFAFDQSFAETFPSMILRTEFDKDGFHAFTYRPVYIEEMIPQPATGRLGREILDRIADYSRELVTTVTVNPELDRGTIHLDPQSVLWTPEEQTRTVALTEQGSWYVSIPIERDGLGTLSAILDVVGPGGAEVRVGRELLWQGDFEDEGGELWNLNSSDEEYDEGIVHQGLRSLRQHRDPQNSGAVTTDLEANLPTLGGTDFSILGWVRTENANDARIEARIYNSRYGGLVGGSEAGNRLSGTNPWTWRWSDFQVQEDASYFEVACVADRPQSGDAYMWYDEIRLVEWEAWQDASVPIAIDYPSNLRFLQVRFTSPSDSATVTWEDQVPEGLASGLSEEIDARGPLAGLMRSMPNPFNQATTIEYRLPEPGEVRIEIYDVGGRRVAVLEEGVRPAGSHRVDWDADDLRSGLYLCKMQIGHEISTRKLVLLR